jgi:hypothetical protein
MSGSKGQQSSIDISRIPPHKFDQPTSFKLSNGKGNVSSDMWEVNVKLIVGVAL